MRAGERLGHEVVVVAPGLEDKEKEKYGDRIIWIKGLSSPCRTTDIMLMDSYLLNRL